MKLGTCLFVAIGLALAFAPGCSEKSATGSTKSSAPTAIPSTVSVAEMSKIGLAFQNYEVSLNKAPGRVEDLKDFLRDLDVEKSAYQKLLNQEVICYWNVTTRNMKNGASNTILAYEKKVPASGGLVLMGSAEVKTMTAGEFASKPKADQK